MTKAFTDYSVSFKISGFCFTWDRLQYNTTYRDDETEGLLHEKILYKDER